MNPRIILLNGGREGEKVEIQDDQSIVLGRDRASDLVLMEKKISRQHARIDFDASHKALYIEDLNSLNGTYINGEAIMKRTLLHEADQIRIGSFLMKVDFPGAPAQEAQSFDTSTGQGLEELDLFEDGTNLETGGRLIAGKLSELSLPDVLQMLATTRKTGLLLVSKEKLLKIPEPLGFDHACFFLEEGALQSGKFNEFSGENAFFQALRLSEGYFALFPLSATQESLSGDTIEKPLEALLLEGLSRLDEQNAEEEFSIEPSDELQPIPGEDLGGLSAEELKVFQLAWKHRKVSTVVEMAPLEEEKVMEILRKLIRNQLIELANRL